MESSWPRHARADEEKRPGCAHLGIYLHRRRCVLYPHVCAGTRRHIRKALELGATTDQVMAVLEGVAVLVCTQWRWLPHIERRSAKCRYRTKQATQGIARQRTS